MGMLAKDLAKWVCGVGNYLSWLLLSPSKFEKLNNRKSKRILIVNLGFIGDVLAITPLIDVLGANGKIVDVLIEKGIEDIFKGNKSVNNIIVYSPDVLEQIRGKYDAAILIHPANLEIAQLLRNARIKYRISAMPNHLQGTYSILFWRIKKPRFGEKQHKVIQNLKYAEMLGIELDEINPEKNPIKIYLGANEIKKTREKFGLKDGFVVISPGSRSQIKMGIRLPNIGKFAAAADYAIEKYGKHVVLVGTKNEFGLCEEIRKRMKNNDKAINLAGKTSLREVFCLIKMSKLILGIDGGNIHVASSLQKKIIDIIRNSQKRIWYPWIKKNNKITLVSRNEDLDNIGEGSIINAVDLLLR